MDLITTAAVARPQEEFYWDKLAEQIWKGNVVLVVGDNFVVDKTTIPASIIKHLADVHGVSGTPETFSELYYSKGFEEFQVQIYDEVSSLVELNQKNFRPTEILEKFLSIEQFPFVITTSFDYTVENTMRRIWGKRGRNVKSLVFVRKGHHGASCDIVRDADMQLPTVYYMFGKANNKREHSFALTDEDMLSYCQAWLSNGEHPEMFSKVLAGKYLLFLGVNYPDWLIRFIWFSMRNNLKDSGIHIGNQNVEKSLLSFFQQVSIRAKSEPEKVYEEIKTRLDEKKRVEELYKFDTVSENTDFFISYSRRDSAWADVLYERLTSMGYKVWYDKKSILCGEEWDVSIRRGIRTTKCFIALLSRNIAEEANDGEWHPYRAEWDIALAHRVKNPNLVKPVVVGSADIFKECDMKLPDEMSMLNSFVWENVKEPESVLSAIVQK